MGLIHHADPARGETYGAPARAAAVVTAAHAARAVGGLTCLWIRAAAGAAAGFAAAGLALAALLAALLLAAQPFSRGRDDGLGASGPVLAMGLPRLALAAYLGAELLFARHFFRRLADLSRVPERHEPANSAEEGAAAFERFLEAAARMGRTPGQVETLIARWCRALPTCGASSSSAASESLARTSSAILGGVTRGNAADMLAYGFLYRAPEELPEGAADAMVRRLERAWGREFAPGPSNKELKLMAHLREPVRASWRPLAFYAGTEAAALAKHWAMLAAGWRCVAAGGGAGAGRPTAIYTYGEVGGGNGSGDPTTTASATTAATTPILFCHGVGLGLFPYVPMLQRLAATGRPVIAAEFKHLAMRWTTRVPTVEQAASELAASLAALGVSRVDAVGHSFGTFFLARLLRTHPELVRTTALLDPVCCCMYTGDLVSTFVYRPHASRNGLVTGAIARDLHAAAAVSRGFFWSNYELWPEELERLGKRALLAVGGRDELVPSEHVAAAVAAAAAAVGAGKKAPVTMLRDERRAHADVVFVPAWQRRALDEALAQMAAADCEELAEELLGARRSRCGAAELEAVDIPDTPAAVVTAAVVARSKAPWVAVAPPAARRASVPAVCADGDEAPFRRSGVAALPVQRSYTIAAGVAPSPSPLSSASWSSLRGGAPATHPHCRRRRGHARSDSASSGGTAAEEEEEEGPAPVFSEDEQEELARRQRSRCAAAASTPFSRCSAQAWAAADGGLIDARSLAAAAEGATA